MNKLSRKITLLSLIIILIFSSCGCKSFFTYNENSIQMDTKSAQEFIKSTEKNNIFQIENSKIIENEDNTYIYTSTIKLINNYKPYTLTVNWGSKGNIKSLTGSVSINDNKTKELVNIKTNTESNLKDMFSYSFHLKNIKSSDEECLLVLVMICKDPNNITFSVSK